MDNQFTKYSQKMLLWIPFYL